MNRNGRVKVLAMIGAAAAATVCAPPIWSALARPKPPPIIEAPPPPPPPPGPVSLPAHTLADAAAYQAYMERAVATSPAFVDGPSVAKALKDASAFEPRGLIRDAVAYGAVAALQDPTFVAAVRNAGDSPENRHLMVGYLIADARYALLFKGSDHAAGLAREAIGAGGLRLYKTGKAVRQASYDIQHQPWSKEDVLDRPDRLKMVEAQGAQPPPDAADHVEALRSAATGAQPMALTAAAVPPPYPPLVAESLQLAAIAALGEASDDLYDRLAGLATDETTGNCLHEAKLNLFQCLAVAKPHYEDIFCMGQHALIDTGTCLATSVGMAMPVEPPPPPPAAKPVPPPKTAVHHRRVVHKRG